MKKLIHGIIDFREHSLAGYREKFSGLAAGQSPDTLFIACCDSRVVPNVFASSDPGDLFVVRNIGNLVPPYEEVLDNLDISVGAAIEFSLNVLKVKDIVICGHSECGAMQTLLANATNLENPFINQWLTYGYPAFKRYIEQHDIPHLCHSLSKHNQLSQVNVLEQIDHLKAYPLVQEKLASGELKLHGWWFDLATADVHYYDSDRHEFVIIDQSSAKKLIDKI